MEDNFFGEGMRVRLKAIPGVTDKGLRKKALEVPFFFQCPPLENFRTEYAFPHSDYDTIHAGQISRRGGGRQLRVVAFDTLLVWQGTLPSGDEWPGYRVTGLQGKPKQGIASKVAHQSWRLRTICESGEPVQLTCTHPMHTKSKTDEDAMTVIDWPVTLRNFSIEERAGEPDARYLNVQFVEYRHPTQDRVALGKEKAAAKFPKVHKLKADDTLVKLAQHYYGHVEGWRLIAEENGFKKFGQNAKIVKNSKKKVGDKITIPKFKPRGIEGGRVGTLVGSTEGLAH